MSFSKCGGSAAVATAGEHRVRMTRQNRMGRLPECETRSDGGSACGNGNPAAGVYPTLVPRLMDVGNEAIATPASRGSASPGAMLHPWLPSVAAPRLHRWLHVLAPEGGGW